MGTHLKLRLVSRSDVVFHLGPSSWSPGIKLFRRSQSRTLYVIRCPSGSSSALGCILAPTLVCQRAVNTARCDMHPLCLQAGVDSGTILDDFTAKNNLSRTMTPDNMRPNENIHGPLATNDIASACSGGGRCKALRTPPPPSWDHHRGTWSTSPGSAHALGTR